MTPLPPDENERLHAVLSYRILDTPPEEAFDRIVALAARLFDAPIALITFIDQGRLWCKARVGIDLTEASRHEGFCAEAIRTNRVLVVEDALCDPRFVESVFVAGEPHARFYAGAPLTTPDGYNIGTLSIADTAPRTFSERDQQTLTDLAATVMDLLRMRLATLKMEMTESVLQEVTRRVSATTGVAFFHALVQHLATMLGVRYALIGELTQADLGVVETRAIWSDGQSLENLSFGVRGSLIEKVFDQHFRYVSYGLSTYYPNDPLLRVGDDIESAMGVVLESNDGHPLGFLAVMNDYPLAEDGLIASLLRLFAARTAAEMLRLRAESALRQSEESYRTLFEGANDAILIFEPSVGIILEVNDKACQLYSFPHAELVGLSVNALSLDPGGDEERIWQALQGPNQQSFETRHRAKDGTVFDILVSLSVVAYAGSIAILSINRDITERKRTELRLLHDALHDALTGLPNRSLFLERLGQAIARRDTNYAVLFMDLDRFKNINDSLGHDVGDQLLIATARRLEASLRPGDTVARLGGDEFTVLLEGIESEAEAEEVAGRIHRALAMPVKLDRHEVFTAASIGIALADPLYTSPEEVLRDADTAMYRAKARGRGRHELFDTGMHKNAVKLLQLETDLRRAVEWEAFQLHYQPIVRIATGKITGFEALVRWVHPRRGLIPPAEFIPVAEETGLIIPVGAWVLHEACYQMRLWRETIPAAADLTISVNLSIKQVMQPDFPSQIERVLTETRLPPEALVLEITETVIMDQAEATAAILNRLHDMGIALCFDDFGTGYSSLSVLHRFPMDTLKIDRSFISRMGESDENVEIVRAVVTLARNLGREVVAEGVETEEQLAQLAQLDCDSVQGFYFSRPVERAVAETLIGDNAPWTRVAWGRDEDPSAVR